MISKLVGSWVVGADDLFQQRLGHPRHRMIINPLRGRTGGGIEHPRWPHPFAAELGDASRKEAVEGISRRPGFAKTGWVDRRQQRRLAPVGVVEVDLTPSPWDLPSVDDFDGHTFARVGPG